MKQFVLVFLIGVSTIMLASAQEFLPAKVIMGDLSEKVGLVLDGTDWEINTEVKFKASAEAPSETILPTAISSIQFENGRWFFRKVIWSEERRDSISVLLKNIVDGKVSVFSFPVKKKYQYFLNKEDQRMVGYKQKASRGLLKLYFLDCQSLDSDKDIKRIKGSRKAINAVKKYNQCVSGAGIYSNYQSGQQYVTVSGGASLFAFFDIQNVSSDYSYRLLVSRGIFDPDYKRNLSMEQGLLLGIDSRKSVYTEIQSGVPVDYHQTQNLLIATLMPLMVKYKKENAKSGLYFKLGLGIGIGMGTYKYSQLGLKHYDALTMYLLPSFLASAGYQFKLSNNNTISLEAGTFGLNVGYSIYNKKGRDRH